LHRDEACATLGVNIDATYAEIKLAFRKMAGKLHPDKGGDTNTFQQILAAYEILTGVPVMPPGKFAQNTTTPKIFSLQIPLQTAYQGGLVTTTNGQLMLPAGIRSGTKLRLNATDFVAIEVEPHPKFKRTDDDLLLELDISAIDAMVGGSTVTFQHLDGKSYDIIIEAGTQPGSIIRMNGRGMKNPEFSTFGDLFILVNITIPHGIDENIVTALKESTMYNSKIVIDTKV
jgi:DnaJ-class molecular chaperone